MKKIKLSSLESFDNLSDAFKTLFSLSNKKLKEFKKELQAINKKDELEISIDLINTNHINPEYSGTDVKILFEDESILALSKPVRVHCHPLKYDESDNLLSFLRSQNYFNLLQINKEQYDRSLLYRLDFETSGLILLAKSDAIYNKIRKNYSKLIEDKTYLALITGKLTKQGDIEHFFKPYGLKGAQMKLCDKDDPLALRGNIEIKTLGHNESSDISLVSVKLNQGHRHQIRFQLKELGHPILGDVLYGGNKADRLYLHCFKNKLRLDKDYLFEDKNLSGLFNLFNFNS